MNDRLERALTRWRRFGAARGDRCDDRAEEGRFSLYGCTVDLEGNRIRRAGKWISLEPKATEVLRVLVEHAGRVVSRDALLDRVWGDVIVSDAVVTVAIAALRKAFGDSGAAQTLIRTVPRAGYRLLASPLPLRPPRTSRSLRVGLASVCLALLLLTLRPPVFDSGLPEVEASIAVLPFRTTGHGAAQDRLARALTGDTIHSLAGRSNVRVIAQLEIERVAAPGTPLLEIAARCRVDRVVDATVHFEPGGEVRLDLGIVDVDLDRHIWTGSFTAPRSRLRELSEKASAEIERTVLRGRPPSSL